MSTIEANRSFMKSNFGAGAAHVSDQNKGKHPPPVQKEYGPDAKVIDLPEPKANTALQKDFYSCLRQRRSRRRFTQKELTLDQLSFLLWATQGVQEADPGGYATLRPVPSAGARHPFETYVAVNRVTGLGPGMYRYLPLDGRLVLEFEDDRLGPRLTDVALGQGFVGDAAAVFMWSCIPYRGEWRYTVLAHKVMLLDAGHVGQNLYLACEALRCGTCAIGAYDQRKADALVGLDGQSEFVVYLAPVGRLD